MFVAGGLIWLNVRQRFVAIGKGGGSGDLVGYRCFGFPVDAWSQSGYLMSAHGPLDPTFNEEEFKKEFAYWYDPDGVYLIRGWGVFWRKAPGEFSVFGIFINVISSFTILLLVTLGLEYSIRKSKFKTPIKGLQ